MITYYYDARKSLGICVRCNRAPAVPERTRCQPCMDASNAAQRKRAAVKRAAARYQALISKHTTIPGSSPVATIEQAQGSRPPVPGPDHKTNAGATAPEALSREGSKQCLT